MAGEEICCAYDLKTVFCSIVDSPPAIFTGLARAKKNAMDQKAILEKCLTPGSCDKDFEPKLTKKLLEQIKSLKHGFESFGSIKLKDKGTQKQRIGLDLNIDLDSKSDSLFSAMMEDRGKKPKQSVSEQTLQATQWIAADSLSPNKKPLNGLTPVHELYRDTYTKMAKNIIKTFHADPKMAGLVQAGLDAVYDSQTDINMVVNGKFGVLGSSEPLSTAESKKYGSNTRCKNKLRCSCLTLNAAIPHSDPMKVPFDLILNTPVSDWNIKGENRKMRLSGLVGFNVSNALFIGPLGEFVDALAAKKKADDEKMLP